MLGKGTTSQISGQGDMCTAGDRILEPTQLESHEHRNSFDSLPGQLCILLPSLGHNSIGPGETCLAGEFLQEPNQQPDGSCDFLGESKILKDAPGPLVEDGCFEVSRLVDSSPFQGIHGSVIVRGRIEELSSEESALQSPRKKLPRRPTRKKRRRKVLGPNRSQSRSHCGRRSAILDTGLASAKPRNSSFCGEAIKKKGVFRDNQEDHHRREASTGGVSVHNHLDRSISESGIQNCDSSNSYKVSSKVWDICKQLGISRVEDEGTMIQKLVEMEERDKAAREFSGDKGTLV